MATLGNQSEGPSLKEMELKLTTEEVQRLLSEIQKLESAVMEAEVKCQRHLEEKKTLKTSLGDLQRQLNDERNRSKDLEKELQDTRDKFSVKQLEWKTFQDDLLTTVRVANDLKTEAQEKVERILIKNKKLSERISELEAEIARLKSSPSELPKTTAEAPPPVAVVPPVAPRKSVSVYVSPVCFATPRSPVKTVSFEPVPSTIIKRDIPITRKSIGKWIDLRTQQQLSVKTLIESLESANKQAKSPKAIRLTNEPLHSSIPLETSGEQTSSKSGPSVSSPVTTICPEIRPTEVLVTTSPQKPLCITRTLDAIRRSNLGYSELLSDKKDDLLVEIVTERGSKRNALLKWCQHRTNGYNNVDITNFSSSWNDGLAFCALLHTYIPDRIPYSTLDSRDKRKNFQLAFDAAASVGIKHELDINEMMSQERPDWHKVMAYVASIYKHFET